MNRNRNRPDYYQYNRDDQPVGGGMGGGFGGGGGGGMGGGGGGGMGGGGGLSHGGGIMISYSPPKVNKRNKAAQ